MIKELSVENAKRIHKKFLAKYQEELTSLKERYRGFPWVLTELQKRDLDFLNTLFVTSRNNLARCGKIKVGFENYLRAFPSDWENDVELVKFHEVLESYVSGINKLIAGFSELSRLYYYLKSIEIEVV